MSPLPRRPVSAGARHCPGRSSLDNACAPAVTWQLSDKRDSMISQIEVSTLSGEPRSRDNDALPGLTSAALERFGRDWNDGGLWDDVLFLAARVWSASEDRMRLISWHHLVLAVGNFRRQGGRRLRPAALHPVDHQLHTTRADELV